LYTLVLKSINLPSCTGNYFLYHPNLSIMSPSVEAVSVAAPEVPDTWDEKSPIAINVVSSIEKDVKTPGALSESSVYSTPTSKFELEDHPIDIRTKLRVSHYIPPSLPFRLLTPLSTGCSNRSRPLWHYSRYLAPSKSSWYRTPNI